MDRLGLSSDESRARIRRFINQRLRRLVTSLGLGRLRLSVVSFATVNGTKTYTPSTLIKPYTIRYAAGNKVLEEMSLDQMRLLDPDESRTGAPEGYAVQSYGATSVTLRLFPIPDAAYTLSVDGLVTGTDLAADADVPAIPEDFHDCLIFGAEADELEKMEKYKMAAKKEAAYEQRKRELRFFLAKSAYLGLQAGTAPFPAQLREPREV